MLGLAARHGTLESSPRRDVGTIHSTRKEVRALSTTQVVALRAGLRQWQEAATPRGRPQPKDLLDVVDVMLATGARIGKALAIRWEDVDLHAERPTLTINGTIIYLSGSGLTIQDHPKSATSRQRYALPQFAVDLLLRRRMMESLPSPSS